MLIYIENHKYSIKEFIIVNAEKKPELSKFSSIILATGVLLIGIAAIGFYLELRKETSHAENEAFWANCVENTIIISARKDLHNVAVSAKNNTLCRFDTIKAGNDEACYLSDEVFNETRVFAVSSDEGKRVVVCYIPVKPVPAGGD